MADARKQINPILNSLTFRVGAFTVLLMSVVLAAVSVTFILSDYQKTTADIFNDGKTFATFTADPIYSHYAQLYTHPQESDFLLFKASLSTILKDNTDIKEVQLVGMNGRILFDSIELKNGKYAGPARLVDNPATLAAVRSDTVVTQDVSAQGKPLTEIVVPLIESSGGHALSMRYLLSYESRAGRMTATYQRTAIVALGLMTFVAAAAIIFANRQTKPVRHLTDVAEQIRVGNFDARARYKSNDEVGRLAAALNEMAEKLKSFYLDLESKVHERTRELEMTQTKLRANVQRDEALLASIGAGVIATDRDGVIVLINKAAADMLKVDRREAIGKPASHIWILETEQGELVKEEDRPVNQALASGTPIRDKDHYCVRRDPAGAVMVRFPTSINVSPVILNGQAIGTINVFSDITHEKEVDRMKTEFISLASHQLRTPLSAIRWFSEMLVSGDAGKLTDEQQEFVRNIYDSTERMIELVNSLLNISRIESGRIIIDPKPTNLDKLIRGVVSDLKAKIDNKGQTLIIDVHKELPEINLDPRLIGQVYMNFLSNAIKYTPKGGEISVFVSRKGEDLVSQITDNGYGIPKAQQGKLFQKFFRAENVTKIETDGTGLGLYLVKAIIESSGGKIWFESEEGKGTTFWFSLPMSGMKAKEGEVTLD